MKKMISFAICAIMMVVCSTATLAQDNNPSKKQRISREQMAEAQAKHIAHELALDDATTQKFVTTYSEYQKEIWALGPRFHGKKHQTEMTDAVLNNGKTIRMSTAGICFCFQPLRMMVKLLVPISKW